MAREGDGQLKKNLSNQNNEVAKMRGRLMSLISAVTIFEAAFASAIALPEAAAQNPESGRDQTSLHLTPEKYDILAERTDFVFFAHTPKPKPGIFNRVLPSSPLAPSLSLSGRSTCRRGMSRPCYECCSIDTSVWPPILPGEENLFGSIKWISPCYGNSALV
jgi:hypothetical protein